MHVFSCTYLYANICFSILFNISATLVRKFHGKGHARSEYKKQKYEKQKNT